MRKIALILMAIVLPYISSVAQDKLSARNILDRTAERMLVSGGVTANFTTTSFQGAEPQESITGTMDILGEKYVMKTPNICTWFNGKEQWNLLADNKEVTLTSPTPEEIQVSSPMSFIGIYKHGFNLSSNKTELRGRKVWDVTLKPQKRKQEPSTIIISIDCETFYPLCIRVCNEGNWTRISINNFKSGAGLTNSYFNFTANEYPGYEIIDLR